MLRPATPRRNPDGTLAVLDAVRRDWGRGVEIHTFGCEEAELDAFFASRNLPGGLRAALRHHGELAREAVADLFAASDIFLDMSHWQAWGRTGLEAMAAGCVPVLPAGSGSEEYARQDVNAKLTNTSNPAEAVAAVGHLLSDRGHRRGLRAKGIWTAGDFDLATASLTLLRLLCDRLDTDVFASSPCRTDAGLDLADDSGERDRRHARTTAGFDAARTAESPWSRTRSVRAKLSRLHSGDSSRGTAMKRARRPVHR